MKTFAKLGKKWNLKEKVALWSGIATIATLFVALGSPQAEPGNQITYGNQSPIINNPVGDIHFNQTIEQQTAAPRSPVLRNPDGGATLIATTPSTLAAANPSLRVCTVPPGTAIEILNETAEEHGITLWAKIRVIKGDCRGHTGWVALGNIENAP